MIFLELLWTFLKIGAFTFGGGYAMLPLIQQAVLDHGWMREEQLINFIAVSESTPGPFAINMATYIGTEKGGLLGAMCATLGVVLPSFVVILIVAKCFDKFKDNRVVKGCMSGLKPAVVGLIGSALLSVAGTVFLPNGFVVSALTDVTTYIYLVITVGATVMAFKKVHPILIICLSAVVGIVVGYLVH